MSEHTPLNLLIVEDKTSGSALPEFGPGTVSFRTYRASSLRQSLSDSGAIDPDVVLLDLMLSDSVGLATFQDYYKNFPMIPVVVMTAENERSLGIDAVKLGAQDYIVKSDSTVILIEKVIRYAVERHRIVCQLTLENELNRRLSVDLEATVKRRTKELHDAKLDAEHNLHIKTHFINNISHEIRTPMTCILGAISLLKGSDFPKKFSPHLDMIDENSRRVFHFFESILDFSEIQSSETAVTASPFRLRDLTAHVTAYVDQHLNQTTVTYSSKVRCSDTVVGDRGMVTKLLQALLSNAIRYTSQGTITLVIWCEIRDDDHWVLFEVGNTGTDISDGLEKILFEPFAQVTGNKTSRYYGAGVGLAICKALATKMGGGIDFRRDPQIGNIFKVELPLARYTQDAVSEISQPATLLTESEHLQ
ncbi:response regulator [bacterium]|nr:response regulator [bacterium]